MLRFLVASLIVTVVALFLPLHAAAEEIPTSAFSCQNCMSWCQMSYQQYGNRSTYDGCVSDCSQHNENCTIPPAPENTFSFRMPAAIEGSSTLHIDDNGRPLAEEENELAKEAKVLLQKRSQAVVERERYETEVGALKFRMLDAVSSPQQEKQFKQTAQMLKQATHNLLREEATIAEIDRKLAERGLSALSPATAP